MKLKINCNWHKYVDLGLPSGLLWATCNVGAKEPWEYGLYFSWGNVDGHTKGSGYDFSETEYASTPGASLPVNSEYDAARANLGGSWRMPTKDDFKELYDNCAIVWATQNGVYGRMFISNINWNTVFFPAAGYYIESMLINDCVGGYYWSSSPHSYAYYAHELSFNSITAIPQNYDNTFLGFTVRPVLDHPKDSLMIRTIKR
jgi:hypothetical protein